MAAIRPMKRMTSGLGSSVGTESLTNPKLGVALRGCIVGGGSNSHQGVGVRYAIGRSHLMTGAIDGGLATIPEKSHHACDGNWVAVLIEAPPVHNEVSSKPQL